MPATPVQPKSKAGYLVHLATLRRRNGDSDSGSDSGSWSSDDIDYSGAVPRAEAGGRLYGEDVAFLESWYARLARAELYHATWAADGAVCSLGLPGAVPDHGSRELSGRRLRFLKYVRSGFPRVPRVGSAPEPMFWRREESSGEWRWVPSANGSTPSVPGRWPNYSFPSVPPYTPFLLSESEGSGSSESSESFWDLFSLYRASDPPESDESDASTPFLGARDIPGWYDESGSSDSAGLSPSPVAAAPVVALVESPGPSTVWASFPSSLAQLSGNCYVEARICRSKSGQAEHDAEYDAVRDAALEYSERFFGNDSERAYDEYMAENPVPYVYDAVEWYEYTNTLPVEISDGESSGTYHGSGWAMDWEYPPEPDWLWQALHDKSFANYRPVRYNAPAYMVPTGVSFSDVSPYSVAGTLPWDHAPGWPPKASADSFVAQPILRVTAVLELYDENTGATTQHSFIGFVPAPGTVSYLRQESESSGAVSGFDFGLPDVEAIMDAVLDAVGVSSPAGLVEIPPAPVRVAGDPLPSVDGDKGTYTPAWYEQSYTGPTEAKLSVTWGPHACLFESGYCVV